MNRSQRMAWALAVALAAALALGLTAWAYFNPHVMQDVANRLWGCF